MKLIDLLNKMANGERLPNKIKLDDKIWTCKEDKKYYNQCEIELIDWYGNELQRCLNDYLELIEDEIDIDNIEELATGYSESGADTDIINYINDKIVPGIKQLDKRVNELESLNIEINEKDINEAFKKARFKKEIEQLNKEIKSIKEK